MDNTNAITHTICSDGIKYAVSKVRDIGYENETKDCFVQALKAVTGVPYRDAHAYVERVYGRKQRKGTFKVREITTATATAQQTVFGYRVFDKKVPVRIGLRRSRFQYVHAVTYPTLGQMMHTFRTGRFVICSSNHAWAIIDGVVYDNGITRSGRRVTEIYEFIPSSKCEAMVIK